MQLAPGDRLGSFRLVEQLGAGGFCDIWLAEHVEVATHRVTIKVAREPEDRELLRREAELLSQLTDRGVVKVLDIHLTAEPPHVVQEYVDGVTLRDWMSEPREAAAKVTVFAQLLEVLDHCHERGIVHRDIKPENVLVDADGGVHLFDFGLGQDTEAEAAPVEDSLKSQAVASGTPSYMSPEQRAGEPVDARSDLYACGIVLFEMIDGRYPSLVDHCGRDVQDPRLAAVVDRVYRRLAAPIDQRYQRAREAVDELGEAFAEVPMLTPAPVGAEVKAEDRVHLEYDVHGCGCLLGAMGVIWTLISLAMVLRGASFARYPLLLSLLLLLGFAWRKKVPYARCRFCKDVVPVERDWPRPWRCTECKQYLDDLS